MSDRLSTDSYKGVRDFYPSDWARLQAMFKTMRDVLARYGYEEYNASPLERAEIYESKTSEEIVNEQTYTFTDRGDRQVTLRPEMTPTLARMVAAKRRELAFPLRWFSIPNVFRYERPQRGRLREHYQLNVDLVGTRAQPEADMEIIAVASAILKAFGAKDEDFVIRINHRGMLMEACKEAGLSEDKAREYLRLLDKKNKMPAETFEEARKEFGERDPLAHTEELEKSLAAYKEQLARKGIKNVEADLTLTRGFDYYTGMVFEVFDTNPENARSLFGGGRYDGLVSLFDSEQVPAVGFGMGDVTLADFLETHDLAVSDADGKAQLYLGIPPGGDVSAAQAFADELRAKGCRVFVNLLNRSLGDQVKDAVKRGIPYFAAYGPEEAGGGDIRLKTLATEEETPVPPAELSERLTSDK